MKKILILSLGRTGSLPIYGEEISSRFKNQNFDILVSKDRTQKRKLINAIEIKTYKNKFTFILNTLIYFPIKFLFFMPKIYKKYSVLYLPYKHFWDLPFILLFKILNRKIVFTVHDGILHKGEKNIITQGLMYIRLKYATEFIFLTSYVKRLVENKYNNLKKSHIIPHPIIENSFFVEKEQIVNTKNLLFLGRIDRYKGVEMLMNSAVKSSLFFDELIIAGKSTYSFNTLKSQKIKTIDKYLSEEEIGTLLSWADILILPYTEATQSGVIALGIFAEKPMICTRVGGFSEQLNDDECFWSDVDEYDLAKVIKEAFCNLKKCEEIKQKLKEKKRNLSWETISMKIEKLLFS